MPLILLILFAATTQAPPPAETAAARAQARACLEQSGDAGVEACRQALALRLAPHQAALVQGSLAVKLALLARWEEAAGAYQDLARLQPNDPEVLLRLGEVLFYFRGQAEEAEAALREALSLDPENARAQLALGIVLHARGEYGEAVRAFEEAERLDSGILEGRPAARAVYEAARRGEKWPGVESAGAQ